MAPGEGKKPTNVLQEIDWDVKAFPHIHNANGKNGKDMVRKSKLTEKTTSYNEFSTKTRDLLDVQHTYMLLLPF